MRHSTTRSLCAEHTKQSELRVFDSARQKLCTRYSDSFSDSNIEQIECDGLRAYRKSHRGEELDADGFLKFASENFGGLKVTSEPDGASIEVDGKAWSDETNAQSSCKVGTRHIKLTKPGYQDETGEAIVKEGKSTIFHKDLKKSSKEKSPPNDPSL